MSTPKITLEAEPPEVKRLLTEAYPCNATTTGKEVLLVAGVILSELLVPSLKKLSPKSKLPAVTVIVPENIESDPSFNTLSIEFNFKPRLPRPFLTKSSFVPRSKLAAERLSAVEMPVFTVNVLRVLETLSTRISPPDDPTAPPCVADEPTLMMALPPNKTPEIGPKLILIPLGTVSVPPAANCKFDRTFRFTSLS